MTLENTETPAPESVNISDTQQVIDFDAIFNTYIADSQKKWAHDRGTTVGASEAFDCIRKVFFGKRGKELGFEPDPDFEEDWGAMRRGDIIENYYVVPAMAYLPQPMKLEGGGDGQQTLVLGKSSATPDGIIDGIDPTRDLIIRGGGQDITITVEELAGATCVTLEIKSIDPRATLVEERVKHHNQTQIQIGLMRELTKWKPSHAIVLYVDASFLSKLTPFVVEYNEEIFITAKQRANDIWAYDDPLRFIPEGRFSGACEHCKFRIACGTTNLNSIPKNDAPVDDATLALIREQALRYMELKKLKDDAERAYKVQAEVLKEHLLDADRKKVSGSDFSASWYSSKGKKTLDRDAVAAAGIDLAPYEKEGLGHDALRVTPRLEGKEKKPRKSKKTEE